MGEPKISVVMPAYNHERFVGAAVESVLGQTCGDLELVVIDDGSTDRTADIVRGYQDPRVRYLHQENQDAYNALNRGLREARGAFVAILNSDDLYAPSRLERLLQEQESSGAVCLFTDVTAIDAEGHPLEAPSFFWNVWHQGNREYYFAQGDLYTGFLHGNFMVTTSNLFLTREAREQIGFFSPLRYLHDYDYIFRALLAYPGRVRYLHHEKLLRYRLHGSNTLKEGAIRAREQDQEVIRKYLLLGLPEAQRARAATGINRLVQLEQELVEVRGMFGADRGGRAPTRLHALLARLRQAMR